MFIVNIDTWYSLAWAVWEVFVVCFCWLFPLLSCLFALKNIVIPVTQNRCTSKVKQRVLLKLFYTTESSSMIWLSTFMDCNFKLSLVCRRRIICIYNQVLPFPLRSYAGFCYVYVYVFVIWGNRSNKLKSLTYSSSFSVSILQPDW